MNPAHSLNAFQHCLSQIELATPVNIATAILFLAGVGILIAWQYNTPGLSSLERCPIRRHRLPFIFAYIQIFFWLLVVLISGMIVKKALAGKDESLVEAISYGVLMVIEIAMGLLLVLVAWLAFARGLRGFGLSPKTLPRDMLWGLVNLVAIYPAIAAMLWLTVAAGKLFNPDFSLETHQTITELGRMDSMYVRIMIIAAVAVVVPIFEELLFRGILQSTLTGYLCKPWLSIAATSAIFALMHPITHFFGLFTLSMAMGYAYEKSGSLLRAIWIHILFNSASITMLFVSGR